MYFTYVNIVSKVVLDVGTILSHRQKMTCIEAGAALCTCPSTCCVAGVALWMCLSMSPSGLWPRNDFFPGRHTGRWFHPIPRMLVN